MALGLLSAAMVAVRPATLAPTVKSRPASSASVALLRPCSTSAGFLATPEPPLKVDMGKLKRAVVGAGFALVVDAKIILIVRKGVESSLYDNGKVLLKTTDRKVAEAGYAELEPLILASA